MPARERALEFVNIAKKVTKAVVPDKILHPLWARYLAAKPGGEVALDLSQYGVPDGAGDFFTVEWLRREVANIADPALTSYFAITPEGDLGSLCAPAHCYPALIDSVIAVSAEKNYGVGHMVDGKRMIASDHRLLAEELAGKPFAQVRFLARDREFAFFVQRWEERDGTLLTSLPNPVTMKIQLDSPSAQAFLESPGMNLAELFSAPLMEDCTFDVDVVYTWVNSEDPEWREQLAEHTDSSNEAQSNRASGDVDSDRYISRDELRYSLRSLLTFAPWVRYVHVVSNCKPPAWFDESNERVRWVHHDEIMEGQHLPTFSSHAIETSIHEVPGLSEQFLYFNDDIFAMQPLTKSDFFLPNGIAKIRLEPYGIVHGDPVDGDPDYINAARNGQALLQSKFAKTPTRLHTHTPQSMRLSVFRSCEETFKDAFESTRSRKFRTMSDISPTSFMYPNYAYLTGNAVMDFPQTALMNSKHPYREMLDDFAAQLMARNWASLPLTLCINDGGGSTQNHDWGNAIVEFMVSVFDEASEAEKAP